MFWGEEEEEEDEEDEDEKYKINDEAGPFFFPQTIPIALTMRFWSPMNFDEKYPLEKTLPPHHVENNTPQREVPRDRHQHSIILKLCHSLVYQRYLGRLSLTNTSPHSQ
jgi:hypothetical protein